MSMITITMRLFGAFRQYGETVEVRVQPGSRVSVIKGALGNILGEKAQNLIHDSVLADEKAILPGEYVVDKDVQLSILPPVCGG